jgi:Mg-chelatase subunit ChlD
MMSNTTPTAHIHHLLILDESGSMSSIRTATVHAYNELMSHNANLVAENADQEHRMSFFTFNGRGIKTICFDVPLVNAIVLNDENYQPNDNTPLYDAMGSAILKVKHQNYGKENHHVLVSVFTDGEENASREFNVKEIKMMVEDLKEKGWAFTYFGTDHDVYEAAGRMGFDKGSTIFYNRSEIGLTMPLVNEARARFSQSVREHKKIHEDLLVHSEKLTKDDSHS